MQTRRLCRRAIGRSLLSLRFATALFGQHISANEHTRYEALCNVERSIDAAEPSAAKAFSSDRLSTTKPSWKSLWAVINDPATSYPERMAAAIQGAPLVKGDAFPLLWTALANAKQQTTVQDSACERLSNVRSHFPRPDLPLYPSTAADRLKTPWKWQVAHALAALYDQVLILNHNPLRYHDMTLQAWRWGPANFWESSNRFVMMFAAAPRNAEFIRNIVRLALSDPYLRKGAAQRLNVEGYCTNHYPELIDAARIVVLNHTLDLDVAMITVYGVVADSRSDFCPTRKPLRTTLLAIARWACDPDLDANSRYQWFARPLWGLVDHPPLRYNPNVAYSTYESPKAVAEFEAFYGQQRRGWEREAAKEESHLRQLLLELAIEQHGVWEFRPR